MSEVRSWVLPDGFLWRAITACLLILDYWLFSTGNPSLSYSLVGGWFWITLLVVAMVISSYVPPSFSGKEAQPFYWLLSIAGVVSVTLFFASPYAHDFAANRMEAQILSLLKDPEGSNVDISPEERQLMGSLKNMKYHAERVDFTPMFREMDYHLTTETGEKYRVTIVMKWDGTPVISMGRVDS